MRLGATRPSPSARRSSDDRDRERAVDARARASPSTRDARRDDGDEAIREAIVVGDC